MTGGSIGVLTTSYPRGPEDPSGRFVAELCGFLADSGEPVEVLAPRPASSEHGGVRVRALRYALRPRLLYGAGAPDNLASSWSARVQVPGLVGSLALACWRRSRDWRRVISHWLLPCGLVAARAARGLPHLAVAHSSDVALLGRLPQGPRLLAALTRPRTGLVLTSEALRPALEALARDEAAQRLVRRAPVIRMGIAPARLAPRDPAAAAALRQAHGIDGATPMALFVGRLVPVKGVDLLIHAMAGLGALLVIVGHGPERPALERAARRRGVPVHFTGPLDGAARDRWLRSADLFVLPSRVLPDGRTDSAPLALLEAMAAGLPVVASRSGGNPELIRDGEDGLLVAPGRVDALAATLRRLLGDRALRRRLGGAARRTAADYTWERVGTRIGELLRGL